MKHPLDENELSAFAGQLAIILHSGISILEGISIMKEDLPSGDEQEMLNVIYNRLEETGDLTVSLRSSGMFPDYFLKMAELGERSGTLEEVMTSLSDYYNRQSHLLRSIRDAIMYPLVLLGMLFGVLLVLMTQVMPVFEQVFEQLGVEITGITSAVFSLGSFLQKISSLLLILVVLLLVLCMLALRTTEGKSRLLQLSQRIPAFYKISQLLAGSYLANALSLSLHSGLDIGEGFELAAGLITQDCYQEKIRSASFLLEQGEELSSVLRKTELFTGMNARMISIGFRTGSAETVLEQISRDCQEQAEERLQNLVGMLEPTLTAVLSVLTGIILISVMLPLLGIMSNIG